MDLRDSLRPLRHRTRTRPDLHGNVLRSLRPLPGGAADASQRTTLNWISRLSRTSSLPLSTHPSESNPLRYSDGHKHRLGVHTARLNETVELKELARIWEITLQRAAPVRQPDRLASDKARYRRTWMRSGLAKIAPAASALGKDLGPCCEVSGHSGARQQGGLRNGWLRRSPSITAIRQERRCGTWSLGAVRRLAGIYSIAETRPAESLVDVEDPMSSGRHFPFVLCRVRGAGRDRRRQRLSVV